MVNIPNILTGLRLALTPAVAYEVSQRRWSAAFWFFAVAALTDLLDGAVARRWKIETKFGMKFDPIADKTLMLGTFLALGIAHIAPRWFVILVIARDAFILGGGLFVMKMTTVKDLPPSKWGKWSTVAQCVAVLLLVGTESLWQLEFFASFAVLISAGLTIWSGIDYGRTGWRHLGTAPSAARDAL